MLNYIKKNLNIITLGTTIIMCVILFIMLDICLLKTTETKAYFKYEEYSRLKSENRVEDAMDLKDTYLELMQIADIYDENTRVEEVEGLNTNEEKSETLSGGVVRTSNINFKSKWRIEIPKINVIAPIKSGTTQDVLATAVGHFEQTDKWNGNVALAGHNRGYNCNFFQNLKKLEIGDKIIYHTEKGEREYKVIVNKIIKQTDWRYIQDTEDNRITLITCVENMFEYRRCIQAVEI